MKEIFVLLDIDNKYAVSSLGRIKNVRTNEFLKQQVSPHGYMTVSLYVDKKRKTYRVHRLVGRMFIDNQENKPYINHKDGDKTNNHICNLEWVTAKENDTHARLNNLKYDNKPILATSLDTNENVVFESLSECARYFKCNKAYIHRALKGKNGRMAYKGFVYKYL